MEKLNNQQQIEKYAKTQKNILIYYICTIVISLLVLILIITDVIVIPSQKINIFVTSICMSYPFVSFIEILKIKRKFKKPEKLKTEFINYSDERNHLITQNACLFTTVIVGLGIFIAIVVSFFTNNDIIAITLSCVLSSWTILFLIIHAICKKKY